MCEGLECDVGGRAGGFLDFVYGKAVLVAETGDEYA